MGFGLWGIFVGEVGLSLSIVMSMTLGIVIDDTVHFLSKYLRARREQGLDAEDAVRYAFRTVGRALLVTSIILVTGFWIIAQSDFAANSDMGKLTAGVIALALIADFLFLPPLLMKIEEKRDGTPSDSTNRSARAHSTQPDDRPCNRNDSHQLILLHMSPLRIVGFQIGFSRFSQSDLANYGEYPFRTVKTPGPPRVTQIRSRVSVRSAPVRLNMM